MSYFVLYSVSIFLKTKTNVDKNFKPWVNKSISSVLIVDSASLSYNVGLKELKNPTL